MDGKLLILCVVVVLVMATLVLARSKKTRRPLSQMFTVPARKPELGMEATDLNEVQGILDRNAALARKTGAGGGSSSWTEVGAADRPAPDDQRA